MKNNVVKILTAAVVVVCLSGTVAYAAENVTLGDLSVGAGEVVEGETVTVEPTAEPAEAAVTNVEGDVDTEPTEATIEDTVSVEQVVPTENVVLAVGAAPAIETVTAGLDTQAEEYELEAADEEEDALGGAFGYTNLGIARVEDHLNVRATAEDDSKIIGKMSNESGCEVLEIVGNKAHIVSGSVEGWVSTDYLLTGDPAIAYAKVIVKEVAKVSADGLKVRSTPSLDGDVISMVAYGEELEVVEELDGWVKVLYDEEEAYVSADYVTVGENLKTALNMTEFLYGEGVSDVRVELCEYAKQFVGNPYVWGGTSLTKGADCSGFVLSVYAKYGIGLPHSSAAQSNMGTAITMAEAKPGDLIFYAKGGRINHVAIYIGGGQVVHASSPSTGIRITSAYYRTPAKVRRFLYD